MSDAKDSSLSEGACPCGHSREHPWVNETPQYSFWGWILVGVVGIHACPRALAISCGKCGHIFEVSHDIEKRQKKRFH